MDNNRLDALFSGLTRTNEAEDKQPIQQETSANAPSTPAKKPRPAMPEPSRRSLRQKSR